MQRRVFFGVAFRHVLREGANEFAILRNAPDVNDAVLARYEAEDPVRINWENGAGGGTRTPSWTETYASWPPPSECICTGSWS